MGWRFKNVYKKQPSAATNPDNHSGSNMERLLAKGLILGVTPGKAACRLSDKPKFTEAFIATILCKPERVKCYLFKTRLKTSLKST